MKNKCKTSKIIWIFFIKRISRLKIFIEMESLLLGYKKLSFSLFDKFIFLVKMKLSLLVLNFMLKYFSEF